VPKRHVGVSGADLPHVGAAKQVMWQASSSCNKYRRSHGETKQLYCDVLPFDRSSVVNSAPYGAVP